MTAIFLSQPKEGASRTVFGLGGEKHPHSIWIFTVLIYPDSYHNYASYIIMEPLIDLVLQ